MSSEKELCSENPWNNFRSKVPLIIYLNVVASISFDTILSFVK